MQNIADNYVSVRNFEKLLIPKNIHLVPAWTPGKPYDCDVSAGEGRTKLVMKNVQGSTFFRPDKTTKVFYNASAYGKEKDDELHALLRYLCEKQATSSFTQNIDTLVETTKKNERFRSLYMSLNIHKDDLLRQGSLIGEKIGFEKGILQGRRDGLVKGAYQKALETAKLMKAENCEAPFIQRMTGLNKHEIDNL